jgi:hypothetical protein
MNLPVENRVLRMLRECDASAAPALLLAAAVAAFAAVVGLGRLLS